ncbi:MAG: hypothetical protein ACFB51_12400 [Anaerolineae bacterium]
MPDTPTDTGFSLRAATLDDIPALHTLYDDLCIHYAITQVRDEAEWQYRVAERSDDNIGARWYYIIQRGGDILGYVGMSRDCPTDVWLLEEISLRASYTDVVPWLVPALRDEGMRFTADQITMVYFSHGTCHPLNPYLEPYRPSERRSYAWYIRVEDMLAFLQHITPALEARLANSPSAGLSRAITLQLYTQAFTLTFDAGQLVTISPVRLDFEDGDIRFPPDLFPVALFGHRSLAELTHLHPDVFAKRSMLPLADILFPKRPGWATPLD